MTSSGIKKDGNSNSNFFMVYKKAPKKKVMLEGIKQVKHMYKNQEIEITPASTLLFELNKLHT